MEWTSLLVAAIVVVYLVGIPVAYGMQKPGTSAPELWPAVVWPLMLAVWVLLVVSLTAVEVVVRVHKTLVNMGESIAR